MNLFVGGGLVVAVGLFITFWSLGIRTRWDPISARLKAYEQGGVTVHTEEELELQAPFMERVIRPNFERLSTYLARQTPEKTRMKLDQKLMLAGRPGGLSASDFQAVRYVLTIVCCLGGVFLGLLSGSQLYMAIFAAVGAFMGLYGPQLWLRQKIGDMRKDIMRALPDALDILTVSVEAGLSFDAAMDRVVDKFDNALTRQFGQALTEIRLGRPRIEALTEMAARTGVDDVHNFVQSLVQSEQMGVGIAKILRVQSDEIRRKRRQRAQEQAAQASLKMLFPMVGCIFPTLWIVLLGPSILILLKVRG